MCCHGEHMVQASMRFLLFQMSWSGRQHTLSTVSVSGCSSGSSSTPRISGAVYAMVPTIPGVKVRAAGAVGVPGPLLYPLPPSWLCWGLRAAALTAARGSQRSGEGLLLLLALLGTGVGKTKRAMPKSPIFICASRTEAKYLG